MHQCELSIATFDDWYKDYPRKEAKLAAQRAYLKAIKSGVTHERMSEGLRKFNAELERRPRERRFVPLPASWINAGRFDDEYEDPDPDKLEPRHIDFWLKWVREGRKLPQGMDRVLRKNGVIV